jgi:hypothetical protein
MCSSNETWFTGQIFTAQHKRLRQNVFWNAPHGAWTWRLPLRSASSGVEPKGRRGRVRVNYLPDAGHFVALYNNGNSFLLRAKSLA